jgi:DNA segregation ATPase FtsK/SpoIIIE, S-DNA-T family
MTTRLPHELLAELCQAVAVRSPTEGEVDASYQARRETIDKEFQQGKRQAEERFAADNKAAETEHAAARRDLEAQFDREYGGTDAKYQHARGEIFEQYDNRLSEAEEEREAAERESLSIYEEAKGGADAEWQQVCQQLDARWRELHTIHTQAVQLLDRWGQWPIEQVSVASNVQIERDPRQRFSHALEVARANYEILAHLRAPRFLEGYRPLACSLIMFVVAAGPAGTLLGWADWRWAVVSAVLSMVTLAIVGGRLYWIARRRCSTTYMNIHQALVGAGLEHPPVLAAAKEECRQLFSAAEARRTAESKANQERYAAQCAQLKRDKERALHEADETYCPRLEEIARHRQQTAEEIDARFRAKQEQLRTQFSADGARLEQEHARRLEESDQRYAREWKELSAHWMAALERFQDGVGHMQSECDRLYPAWNAEAWQQWKPPEDMPAVIRFGRGMVRLGNIKAGIPKDERLRPHETEFVWPALVPFPDRSLLLLRAEGEGRAKAVEALQAVMLRMLTAVPPGKVRFTILDPVGLGENFAAFMHLADYDEQLVASRIWTDAAHIEQRLADLTGHMENVLQVYLRNEFTSIQDYNATAGEMAEPYRVLVVANFPANFTDAAVQRLKSIVSSGARCGVFVLLSVDTKMPLPRHFQLADLEAQAFSLRWHDGGFVYEHPQYGKLPLELEPPPPAERFTELVRKVGALALDASRVEVPFSGLTAAEEAWWHGDSRGGLEVPLGRAGAMKVQYLELGKGTSQHVLISGKTGSGKSTLLHVLITNLALQYSPDEVQLYLVDFKKGVEFKAYARAGLPHARVIAIESEREFGLSVLQRLDAELRERGDMFRRLGVQEIRGFRNAQPDAKLPRILLMIDEFQELFVDDDRIAQESTLLLDRLVRQGRAFGIHVLLGSQTLGGAYSLARSTIGQMAVRIALQCSESDAHLILSEENTAARLLTRPGEAIYNDANGLFEGNHPFQVVWLSDDERDAYLARVAELARQKNYRAAPPIVFEGNVLADAADNPGLSEMLAAPTWPESVAVPRAWLGSAVAIKEPTSAAFVRQAGANLLMVGRREEAALGVMMTSLLSLAAQHAPDAPGRDAPGTRFYVLDGTRPEAPEVGFWHRLEPVVPHRLEIGDPRRLAVLIGEVAEDLARRQQDTGTLYPPLYLFVYNLGRFRELRKEDDYSFGSRDDEAPPNPAKQFSTILREGPALGIHVIAWCDTYATVNRLLDRQAVRDFELRALFQMSATDSSSLIESPDAARLGVHRALLYDEGQGRMEKFRPYGVPSSTWLETIAKQLRGRLA